MSDEQLAGCVSSAESGEAVAEMVSRYTGLVLALAGKYSGGADYEELVSDGLDALLSALRKYSPEKGSFSGFASVCVSNRMKNAVDRAAMSVWRSLLTRISPTVRPRRRSLL